jgi:pyruvate,water dikinase
MTAFEPIVMPLATPGVSIELVGGKGRALAALAMAGLPVPTGFLISTRAYNAFIRANALQPAILKITSDVDI